MNQGEVKSTPRSIKRLVRWLWIAFGTFVVLCSVLFCFIAWGWIGYMPEVDELENPNYKFASEILSSDGKTLGTWSLSKENRVYVGYKDMSHSLIDALIATEDVRFEEHSGIDIRALGRAIVKRGIFLQKNAGGGSTITQQLSKQLYSPGAGNFMERLFQKPIEWVIAVKLERYYTKEELLTMYFNKYDFGNNAVGIKTAANTYFSKDPADLTIEEAATLVGMCKNSSLFNPVRRRELVEQRRNVVLDQMRKADYITEEERDSLMQIPLRLKFHRVDHKEGLATYFREYLRIIMTAKEPHREDYASWQTQKFYEDSLAWENNPLYGWCSKNRKKDGTSYNIYTDGLKIYTTIDSHMQQYAEEAVEEHVGHYLQPLFFKEKRGKSTAPFTNQLTREQVKDIMMRSVRQSERYNTMRNAGYSESDILKAFKTPEQMSVFTWHGVKDTVMTPMDSIKYYKFFLRAGFMSMDPTSGAVKAYVGGPNYAFFQYDMAEVGRRQVGSTIKPFLYALAMENGFTPCDVTRNVPQTLITAAGESWTPRNTSSKRYGEMVTLKWGLANSNNWISAYLMSRLNASSLVRLIHRFGVKNRNIVASPSLCLGPCEISVGEMVSAYTAFVNNGLRCEPMLVTKIEDNEGNVIATFHPQMEEVISASSASKMLTMLRAVINEGTGMRVRRYTSADVGGKTGTTQRNSDGWFVGFTPKLVTGCWVGGEDRDIHFDTMFYGQGAAMALPIWGIFMKKVFADKSLGYSESDVFPYLNNNVCGNDSISANSPGGIDSIFSE